MSKWIKNQRVYGSNHIPFQSNDSISFRALMPDRTKKQIKSEKNLRKFIPINPGNGKVKKIEGLGLVEKFLSEGNKEEAQFQLNKFVFENQIRPGLDIIALGIENDLISFEALDFWNF